MKGGVSPVVVSLKGFVAGYAVAIDLIIRVRGFSRLRGSNPGGRENTNGENAAEKRRPHKERKTGHEKKGFISQNELHATPALQ